MRYIYSTTKGYRVQFFILFFAVVTSTITDALFPSVIGEIVDQIFYEQQMKGFLLWFLLYAGLYLINQCLYGVLNFTWAQFEVSYVVNIRKQCFAHLLKLKASIWTKIKSGDVIRRISGDTEFFLEFIHRSLFYILSNFLQLVISIGYLLYTNLALGIITIVMTPIMAYSIRFFSEKLKKKHQEIQTQKGVVDAWILEMITGIHQWKLLNAQTKVKKDYRFKTEQVICNEKKRGYLELTSESVNEALTLFGQLFIYSVAAFCVGRKTMTVGQFVACAAYFSTCSTYYNTLGKKITDISGNLVGIRRVKEFMEWEEEQEMLEAEDTQIENGNICFENVSFGYEKEIVLKKINLTVQSGEKIVLVGKSGEGKSTLLQLIYRLYDPIEGVIYVDGRNILGYTLSSLRTQIAVVQQNNGLFHGTLRKNIILSDEKTADERIWYILEGLKLKEVVEALPEGLDTTLGSGERELSGGQRQRIAIARCIFRNPKILLLDEATSALDVETEAIVNAFIYRELPNTTIISVAHRFSTVLSSKKAVVIEQGQVTNMGGHAYLMQENALYRLLYDEYLASLHDKDGEGK